MDRCKEALVVGGGDGGSLKQFLCIARCQTAQDLFHLAPQVFNGIEVLEIGRQIQQPGTVGFNGFAPPPNHLVRRQIVQDHQSSVWSVVHQALPNPGQKHLSVHRPFKQPRSVSLAQVGWKK